MSATILHKIAMSTVVVAAATVSVGASSAMAHDAEPPRPKAASVTGSAEFAIPFIQDTDIRSFTFDAHAVPYSVPAPNVPTGLPTDARGTVQVSHYAPDEGITVWWEAEVDCLVTDPRGASLTAVVTKAHPLAQDLIGNRAGFSVYDGGRDGASRSRDRVGFSWTAVNLDRNDKGEYVELKTVGTCLAPAAFSPVTKGGYTVKHADLLPPPQAG